MFLLLACTGTADIETGPDASCEAGFERHDDGDCYAVETEGDTDTDTDADSDTDSDTDTDTDVQDVDGDGSPVGLDCDDNDSRRYPGAAEVCDGVDNDCDAGTPEPTVARYADADGDGFGAGDLVAVCEGVSGYAAVDGDCDDASATSYPGAADDTDDDADNDCDGSVDEDYDACAVAYGRATWADRPPVYVQGYAEYALTIVGDFTICSVTCDATWIASAEVRSCSWDYEVAPYGTTTEAYVCLELDDPDVRSEATCEAYTSAGMVTMSVIWSE